jgi:hypothetical protein
MRPIMRLGLVLLSLTACRQTVFFLEGDGGGGDGGPLCSGQPTDFAAEYPEVIVALDRSTGMSVRFVDSTPLVAARDALDLYAALYQKIVRFGYIDFPEPPTSPNQFCSGSQQVCCAGLLTPPNSNIAAFENALHLCDQPTPPSSCSTASAQRPTVPALATASITFMSRPGRNRHYILLITNGEPDCSGTSNTGCMDAQNLAGQLFTNEGVRTIVVAPVPETSSIDCLKGLAVQGGADTAPYYHPASTTTDLSDDLAGVTRGIARDACHLDLDLTSTSTRIQDASRAALYWKDMPVPFDHSNGWDLSRNGFTVDLNGPWCDRLIDGDPKADFTLFTDCNPPRR